MHETVILQYASLAAQPWDRLARDWLPRLPADKRVVVERLRDPVDRARTLLGIALLAEACIACGHPFDAAALEYPPRARPRLPGGPEFSIAHGGDLVAAAVGAAPLGLDLERAGAARAADLRLVLDDVERGAVADGRLDATDAWVMKEAVLKAAGRGADGARAVSLRGHAAAYDGVRWHLRAVPLPGHRAWLALREPAADVVVRTGAGSASTLPTAR